MRAEFYMKNKGWIVVIIILLPALIWVLLDVSLINSRKLNYFGPKQLASNGKDTIYYSLGTIQFYNDKLQPVIIDTNDYKVFLCVFLKPEYLNEKFRIAQWLNTVHFEPDKLKHIPTLLIYPVKSNEPIFFIKDSLKINLPNVQNFFLPDSVFHKINMKFFSQKPYYVDYSFAVLVDKKRNIRGYYDWRFADEVKRSIQEFNHLILKEGYKETLEKNKIEKK